MVELTLSFDGNTVAPTELAGLRLTRNFDAPASLVMHLSSYVGLPEIGTRIALHNEGGQTLFDGKLNRKAIEHLQGQTTADLTAEDALAELGQMRSHGVEDGGRLEAVVSRFAARVGLGTTAHTPDIAAGRLLHRHTDDLAFLTDTLARYGWAFFCRAGQVHLHAAGQQPAGGEDLSASVIRLQETETHAPAKIGFLGWLAQNDNTISGGEGADGPWSNPCALRPDEDAEAISEAVTRQRSSASHWMQSALRGIHDLWPGDCVILRPGGPSFRLTQVEIAADAAGGWQTTISSEPAALQAPEADHFFVGEICNIEDPARHGRVRVALHGFDGAMTGWIPALTGGGADRAGLNTPLSCGDPVIVAAPQGDPERGVVLGAVSRVTPTQVKDGARTGMSLGAQDLEVRFDEEAGQIELRRDDTARISLAEGVVRATVSDEIALTLEDGTSIEVTPGRINLRAQRSLDLDCDGDVRIRGRRIDFVEAG